MKNASDFFRSINRQYADLLNEKKEISNVLEKILKVPITDDMFFIKESSVEIKPNPFLKSKISLHKKEIEKELSNIFQKKISLR